MKNRTTATARLLALAILAVCASAAAWSKDGLDRPVPVRTVAPQHPVEQKRAGVCGIVTLSFLVDAQGAVRGAQVLDATNEAFTQPALDAIAQWKFKPAQRDGVAVAVPVAIPMVFTLDGEDERPAARYLTASLSRLGLDSAPFRPEARRQLAE